MPERKSSQFGVIVTALISAASGFGVGYLSYRSTTADVGARLQEIALEQNRFDAEERSRFEETISTIIPQILDPDVARRETGLAMLFTLYPARAEEVLASIRAAVTEIRADSIRPALERAMELRRATGTWLIVAGSDRTRAAAQTELDRAESLGYSPTLYRRDDWFVTTIGPFQSRVDADRANIAIRELMRRDAFVVNLNAWCPNTREGNGLVECAPGNQGQ